MKTIRELTKRSVGNSIAHGVNHLYDKIPRPLTTSKHSSVYAGVYQPVVRSTSVQQHIHSHTVTLEINFRVDRACRLSDN